MNSRCRQITSMYCTQKQWCAENMTFRDGKSSNQQTRTRPATHSRIWICTNTNGLATTMLMESSLGNTQPTQMLYTRHLCHRRIFETSAATPQQTPATMKNQNVVRCTFHISNFPQLNTLLRNERWMAPRQSCCHQTQISASALEHVKLNKNGPLVIDYRSLWGSH